MQYNLILLSLIKSLLGGRRTLPLTLPRSETHTDKGSNLCTRLGLVFAIGGSMVIALHARAAGFSRAAAAFVSWWSVGRFRTVFVSLQFGHLSPFFPSPPPPPLFLKTIFFLFLCCFLEYQRENTERERDTEILHILYFVWSIGIFTFYSAYSYKETRIMFLSWPILCELSWNYRFWSGVTLKQNAACRIS